jgi:phosphotransferase system enzyme I (PtsI)
MLELQGVAVSPGVAIGHVFVFDREGYRISRCRIASSEIESELERLTAAVDTTRLRLVADQKATSAKLGQKLGDIFSAQQQMLLDPRMQAELRELISGSEYAVEFAVSEVLNRYAAAFRRAGNSFLAERAADIHDVERLLLESLTGKAATTVDQLSHEVIIASNDLTPGETARLDTDHVLAFCTEAGGAGGHTAIVARGLEIPAVVGIGDFLLNINRDSSIIVDGYKGRVIIDPDEQTLIAYRERKEQRLSIAAELQEFTHLPAMTRDNVEITLLGNIEFPQEAATALARGASGIGLYRTEFLYLGAITEPTEEEHFEAYCEVARTMPDSPIMIRTLDLGADKMWQNYRGSLESNPFLGLRSIRLSLRNPALFRTQLRAILRAAVHGDLRIMFPMVTTLDELRSARFILRSISEDLLEEGIEARVDIPVGMMVEVPAAVLMLDRFAEEVDFISIGTNDLTQYTLAVDRSNEAVADLYQACDPAVLRLIRQSIDVCHEHKISSSVCGEMSSNPAYALLLIGLGVRTLSVPPPSIPQVKQAIRAVSLRECEAMAWRAMRLDTANSVDTFLNNQLADLMPDVFAQL